MSGTVLTSASVVNRAAAQIGAQATVQGLNPNLTGGGNGSTDNGLGELRGVHVDGLPCGGLTVREIRIREEGCLVLTKSLSNSCDHRRPPGSPASWAPGYMPPDQPGHDPPVAKQYLLTSGDRVFANS